MVCRKYIALYTSQKTKKSKAWKDGSVTVVSGNASISGTIRLLDEAGKILEVESNSKRKIEPGDEFELGAYLVQIEDLVESDQNPSEDPAANGDANESETRKPAAHHNNKTTLSLRIGNTPIPNQQTNPGLNASKNRVYHPIRRTNKPLSGAECISIDDHDEDDPEMMKKRERAVELQNQRVDFGGFHRKGSSGDDQVFLRKPSVGGSDATCGVGMGEEDEVVREALQILPSFEGKRTKQKVLELLDESLPKKRK